MARSLRVLRGKVCVVTGASSGIGRQTALDLATDEALVVAVARRRDRLESLLAEMGGAGAGHSLFVADVSNRQEVRALAGHTQTTYGRCDALINNAGFSNERPLTIEGGVEDLEKVMATNFYGTVYCTAEFLPLLRESAPSSVVNVASIAGRLAIGGAPAYTASKFAVVGWSEALHFKLAEHGIAVSLVEPGLIPTEGFPQTPLLDDRVLKRVLGTTEDVSKAIRSAIRNRRLQRVVPRWYYLLQIPRLLAPPLYREAQLRLIAPRRRATLEGSSY